VNWVCLEATNALGCKDTACRKIENDYEMAILPPNVFTPNADGFSGKDKEGLEGNEVFNIYTKNVEYYHLVIYDRWGVKVFESEDSNYDWNGRYYNDGYNCPTGTYYYILDYRYKGKDENEPIINGVVRIIR
jgi:gliding motility-associated-like protein